MCIRPVLADLSHPTHAPHRSLGVRLFPTQASLRHGTIWGGRVKLVICLYLCTCQAAQLPHPRDGRARVTREARNDFAPYTRAKTAALAVCRDRKLERRAGHAVRRWQGEVA